MIIENPMQTIFIILALIGCGYYAISLMFGDFHHDGAADFDADGHLDHHDDVTTGPKFFSMRAIAIMIGGFGLSGLLCDYYGLHVMLTVPISAAIGFVFGIGAYFLAKFMWSQQSSKNITAANLIGKIGSVAIAIPTDGIGEIKVVINNYPYHMSARSISGREIKEGTSIEIKEVVSGTAIVFNHSKTN